MVKDLALRRAPIVRLVAALSAVAFLAPACQRNNEGAKRAEERIEQRTKELTQLAEKRQERTRELAAMGVPELARELEAESKRFSEPGAEPFNSMAFKELVSRGEQRAPELRSQLQAPDRTSFLGLLALHDMGPRIYREVDTTFRVSVLVDALRTSKYFNTWGLPHLYWEDPAKRIIEEGKAAEGPLLALLSDERPAPMWGSDEVIEYERYRYRVRDYAWALLRAIRGETGDIPTDPAARDRLISAYPRPPQ